MREAERAVPGNTQTRRVASAVCRADPSGQGGHLELHRGDHGLGVGVRAEPQRGQRGRAKVGCRRHDPVAVHTVLVAERTLTTTRTKHGVDPTGCRVEPARQRGKVPHCGIGPAGDTDRVLSGGDGPPHPVPAVLGRPPAGRSDRSRSDRARHAEKALEVVLPSPPGQETGTRGAVSATYTSNHHDCGNARGDDEEQPHDTHGDQHLLNHGHSVLHCQRVADPCVHITSWPAPGDWLRPGRSECVIPPRSGRYALVSTADGACRRPRGLARSCHER